MSLTESQRARIAAHMDRGWKLPDSLAAELWSAYRDAERRLAAAELAASPARQPAEDVRAFLLAHAGRAQGGGLVVAQVDDLVDAVLALLAHERMLAEGVRA